LSTPRFTLAEHGPKIRAFLLQLFADARFELKFDIGEPEGRSDFETPDILVRFGGRDVELLLANKAELLLALEQLTMEMLRMGPEEHSRLQFDANDYRMLRIEELRLSAMTAAERVKRTKTPFFFNPMNSRERRIIHLALRDETAVRSESTGMGPQRAVVVYPAGMPAVPTPPAPSRPMGPRRGGPGGHGGHGGGRDRRR
jgi:spoIIIJ-associated protein